MRRTQKQTDFRDADHLFCVLYSVLLQLLFSTENVYMYSGKRLVLKRCAFSRKQWPDQQLMSINTVVMYNSHLDY